MRKLSILVVLVVIAIATNCTPYAPDLGGAPYLCANDVCPEGYTCMTTMDMPPRDKVCLSDGAMPPDAGSGGGFQCAMDGSLEPNDTKETAFQTDVPSAPMMTRTFGPISICPEGDKDHFAISLPPGNLGIEAIVSWDTGMPINVNVLNAGGTSIANGTTMGPKAFRACAANLPMGTYFASAFAAGIKNNYRISLKIVANCAI